MRQAFAESDAGIEATFHEIDHAVVADELERDVRVGGGERAEVRKEEQLRRHARDIQAQQACRLVARLVDAFDRLRERGQRGLCTFEKLLAQLGHADAARGAVEQAHAELLFERAHGLREGRGRHAQLLRGAREAGVVRHAGEGGNGGQELGGHGGHYEDGLHKEAMAAALLAHASKRTMSCVPV
jgi:hypothetical protein